LAASYKLTDMWSLFGRIENATDTNYQSPEGFPAPGHRRLWRDQGDFVSMKQGIFAAAALLLVSGRWPPRLPQRIMSLKICTDELLLDLVPARVLLRSHSCRRSRRRCGCGRKAQQCRSITVRPKRSSHPSRPDPDRSFHGAIVAAAAGQKRREILEVPPAEIFDIRAVTRMVAKAVGEEARGEALIAKWMPICGTWRRIARRKRSPWPVGAAGAYVPGTAGCSMSC